MVFLTKKKKSRETRTSIFKKIKGVITNEEENKEEETTTSLKEVSIKSNYESDKDLELDIPIVPEAPKKKNKLTLNNSNLSTGVLDRMEKVKSPDVKVVLVNCERCKDIIPIPIPKRLILESELPVVPISYVHKNLLKKDQHCLTIHIDHDFDIRRQRISDVVLSSD